MLSALTFRYYIYLQGILVVTLHVSWRDSSLFLINNMLRGYPISLFSNKLCIPPPTPPITLYQIPFGCNWKYYSDKINFEDYVLHLQCCLLRQGGTSGCKAWGRLLEVGGNPHPCSISGPQSFLSPLWCNMWPKWFPSLRVVPLPNHALIGLHEMVSECRGMQL